MSFTFRCLEVVELSPLLVTLPGISPHPYTWRQYSIAAAPPDLSGLSPGEIGCRSWNLHPADYYMRKQEHRKK